MSEQELDSIEKAALCGADDDMKTMLSELVPTRALHQTAAGLTQGIINTQIYT